MILTLKLTESARKEIQSIVDNALTLLEELGVSTRNIKQLPRKMEIVSDPDIELNYAEFFEAVYATINFKISKKQVLKILMNIDNILDALDFDLGQNDRNQIAEIPIHQFKQRLPEDQIRKFNESCIPKNDSRIWFNHNNFGIKNDEGQDHKLAIVDDGFLSYKKIRQGDDIERDGVRQPSFEPSTFQNNNKFRQGSQSKTKSTETEKTKKKKPTVYTVDDKDSSDSEPSSLDGRKTTVRKVRSRKEVTTPEPSRSPSRQRRSKSPSRARSRDPDKQQALDLTKRFCSGKQRKTTEETDTRSSSPEEIVLGVDQTKEKDQNRDIQNINENMEKMHTNLSNMETNLRKELKETREKVDKLEQSKLDNYQEKLEEHRKKAEELDKERFNQLTKHLEQQRLEMVKQSQEMFRQQQEFQQQFLQLNQQSLFMSCQPHNVSTPVITEPGSLQSTAMSNLGIGQGSFNPNFDPNFFNPVNPGFDWRQMRPLQPATRPSLPQPFAQSSRMAGPQGKQTTAGHHPVNLSRLIPDTRFAPPPGMHPASTAQPPPAGASASTPGTSSSGMAAPTTAVTMSQEQPRTADPVTEIPAVSASSGNQVEAQQPGPANQALAVTNDPGQAEEIKDKEDIISVSSAASTHNYEDIISDEKTQVDKILSRSRQGKNDIFKSTTESEEETPKEFYLENTKFECSEYVLKLITQMMTGTNQDCCNAVTLLHSYALENKHKGGEQDFRDTLIYILVKTTEALNLTHLEINTTYKLTNMGKEIGQIWREFQNDKSKTRQNSTIYENNVQMMVSYGLAEKTPEKGEKSKKTRRKRTVKK